MPLKGAFERAILDVPERDDAIEIAAHELGTKVAIPAQARHRSVVLQLGERIVRGIRPIEYVGIVVDFDEIIGADYGEALVGLVELH